MYISYQWRKKIIIIFVIDLLDLIAMMMMGQASLASYNKMADCPLIFTLLPLCLEWARHKVNPLLPYDGGHPWVSNSIISITYTIWHNGHNGHWSLPPSPFCLLCSLWRWWFIHDSNRTCPYTLSDRNHWLVSSRNGCPRTALLHIEPRSKSRPMFILQLCELIIKPLPLMGCSIIIFTVNRPLCAIHILGILPWWFQRKTRLGVTWPSCMRAESEQQKHLWTLWVVVYHDQCLQSLTWASLKKKP